VVEEQPNGTIVYKFVATDADSNIESYQIVPKNPYFFVEPGIYIKILVQFKIYEICDGGLRSFPYKTMEERLNCLLITTDLF